ncbi:MAG: DUF4258 domain-containing protein [Armatimonadetes bacterium]|nr:DUF4258 domain-containing protein [Armatimonadota bacterium]
MIRIQQHASERMLERGATEAEVALTVHDGEQFAAKFGRTGFRRNFPFSGVWRGKRYATKQVEVLAVLENGDWLVITVITRFF